MSPERDDAKMEIACQSYIKIDNEFVPIEEFSGPLPDVDYVEGAIELSLNNVCMLDRRMWDLVDQLWAYIVNGIGEISEGKSHSCYFPDQPIELKFLPIGADRVWFSVLVDERNVVIVDRQFFVKALLEQADGFFAIMTRLAAASGNAGCYDAVVDKIRRIQMGVM